MHEKAKTVLVESQEKIENMQIEIERR